MGVAGRLVALTRDHPWYAASILVQSLANLVVMVLLFRQDPCGYSPLQLFCKFAPMIALTAFVAVQWYIALRWVLRRTDHEPKVAV